MTSMSEFRSSIALHHWYFPYPINDGTSVMFSFVPNIANKVQHNQSLQKPHMITMPTVTYKWFGLAKNYEKDNPGFLKQSGAVTFLVELTDKTRITLS